MQNLNRRLEGLEQADLSSRFDQRDEPQDESGAEEEGLHTPLNPDPDSPTVLGRNLEAEREAYAVLTEDNGHPCYPIELGIEIFDQPGQYQGIIHYWQRERYFERNKVLTAQLTRWKAFRYYQARRRSKHNEPASFAEFCDRVAQCRSRHGCQGGIHLLEQTLEQNEITDWTEYQYYELLVSEEYQQKLSQAKEKLSKARETMDEAGILVFENTDMLTFRTWYDYARNVHEPEVCEAQKEISAAAATREMEEWRLEIAAAYHVEDGITKDSWIRRFEAESELADKTFEGLRAIYKEAEAERKLCCDSYWACVNRNRRKTNAHDHRALKGITENEQQRRELADIEKERLDLDSKHKEASRRAYEASIPVHEADCDKAKKNRAFDAAKSDNLPQSFSQGVLTEVLSSRLEAANLQLHEGKERQTRARLTIAVVNALYGVWKENEDVERHKILLDWIENHRQQILANPKETSGTDLGTSKSIADNLGPNIPSHAGFIANNEHENEATVPALPLNPTPNEPLSAATPVAQHITEPNPRKRKLPADIEHPLDGPDQAPRPSSPRKIRRTSPPLAVEASPPINTRKRRASEADLTDRLAPPAKRPRIQDTDHSQQPNEVRIPTQTARPTAPIPDALRSQHYSQVSKRKKPQPKPTNPHNTRAKTRANAAAAALVDMASQPVTTAGPSGIASSAAPSTSATQPPMAAGPSMSGPSALNQVPKQQIKTETKKQKQKKEKKKPKATTAGVRKSTRATRPPDRFRPG